MQRELHPLGWAWFDVVTDRIAASFDRGRLSGVFGVPRGGLIPAVALSHRLDLPLLMEPNDSMLWVDDIIDSGQTLKYWRAKYPSATYSALIGPYPGGAYCGDYITRSLWYVFPWEDLDRAADDMAEYMAKAKGVANE